MPNDRASPSGPKSSVKGQVVLSHGASIGATSVTEATVAFAGAVVGDEVSVSPGANFVAGIGLSHARVSTTDTIAIGLMNMSTATLAPGTVTYQVTSTRR